MPEHAGKSEWFMALNVITALIVFFAGCYFHGFRYAMLYAAIFLLIELPLDAILICATLTAIEIAVIGTILYYTYQAFTIF